MDTQIRRFRLVALTEAVSFLALLVATWFKHAQDEAAGVQVLGPLHGALFIAYALMALNLAPRLGWGLRTTLLVLAGAVFPLGGFAVDRWLARRDVPAAA